MNKFKYILLLFCLTSVSLMFLIGAKAEEVESVVESDITVESETENAFESFAETWLSTETGKGIATVFQSVFGTILTILAFIKYVKGSKSDTDKLITKADSTLVKAEESINKSNDSINLAVKNLSEQTKINKEQEDIFKAEVISVLAMNKDDIIKAAIAEISKTNTSLSLIAQSNKDMVANGNAAKIVEIVGNDNEKKV